MSDHRRQIDPDTGLPAEPELPEPSVEEPDPDLRVKSRGVVSLRCFLMVGGGQAVR